MPIFGNGDIDSPEKHYNIKNRYGDGIMIGRAAIGYPWILTKSNITSKQGTFSKTNRY
jgi:tRNA-dihydrouridine synthase